MARLKQPRAIPQFARGYPVFGDQIDTGGKIVSGQRYEYMHHKKASSGQVIHSDLLSMRCKGVSCMRYSLISMWLMINRESISP